MNNSVALPGLSFLRALIDNIDSAILSILIQRANVVNLIQQYKKTKNLGQTKSPLREKQLSEVFNYGTSSGLSEHFLKSIFDKLYEERDNFITSKNMGDLSSLFNAERDYLADFNRTLKNIDISLCCLLAERMQLVMQVGQIKKQNNIKALDNERWNSVLTSKTEIAEKLGANSNVIRELYTIIHDEALRIEG